MLYATRTMTKAEILIRADSELTTCVPLAGAGLVVVQLLEKVRGNQRGDRIGVTVEEAAILCDQIAVATRV